MLQGLFWRVFAWYLAATIAILVVGLSILRFTDSDSRSNPALTVSEETIRTQADAAVGAWREGGRKKLVAHFASARRPHYLFDASGRELTGKPVPAAVASLEAQARNHSELQLTAIDGEPYAGASATVAGTRYIFVRGLPKQQFFPLMAHPLPVWGRLGLGMFTALVLCVLFARYVTSPLSQLRATTRAFAAGDLEARVGNKKPFHRRDEFADLASDFDNMAAQIQNLFLSQQRMLGDISHELRSPLARLQIALEMARRKAGDAAQGNLDRIEQEAERMNSLIGMMLRSARTEHMRPGKRRLFDLANLVTEVAADADFEATAHDRRVTVPVCTMSVVHGDRELIRSAIENVVRNAIRYTPAGTPVVINLRRADGHAYIKVRDQGPGVPEQALPHLFEPFYRVNDARDRDSGGVGLGLAITRQVVTAHGGSVRASNCTPAGLEVTIELPLKVPELTQRAIRFRS